MYEQLTQEQKDFVDKLVAERDSIIRRADKLNAFLYKGQANSLSCDARCLLEDQKRTMEQYIKILNKRIDCYVRDCTAPLATNVCSEVI